MSASAVQLAAGGVLAGYGDDASPGKEGFGLRLAAGTGVLLIDRFSGPPLDCGLALQADRWTSVCAVHNGSALALHVNGTRACSAPATLATTTAASAFAVGCMWRGKAGSAANATRAALDEVRLWDAALTAEQVAYVANAPRPALHFPFHLPQGPLAYLTYEGGGAPASPVQAASMGVGNSIFRDTDPFGLPLSAAACSPCALTATPPAGLLPWGGAARSVCFWSWIGSLQPNDSRARIVEWGNKPLAAQAPPSQAARFGVRVGEFSIFTYANDAVDYQCDVAESLRWGSGPWRHVCVAIAGASSRCDAIHCAPSGPQSITSLSLSLSAPLSTRSVPSSLPLTTLLTLTPHFFPHETTTHNNPIPVPVPVPMPCRQRTPLLP